MNQHALHNLLAALLAGPWTEVAMLRRAKQAIGKQPRFLRPFVRRVLIAFPAPTHFDRLLNYAKHDEGFTQNWAKAEAEVETKFTAIAVMAPHPAAKSWNVPAIVSQQTLCELLRIDRHQLDWLADVAGRNHREQLIKLRHYHYRWLPKPDGRSRLLEIPKPMLMGIQGRILHRILDSIPPHPAAHAFRAGHSIKTNAEQHTDRAIVVRFDLQDFFPSITANAVTAIFRTAGYPSEFARLLTSLCTTRLPRDAWDQRPNPSANGSDHHTWQRFHNRHLPQGAPTSPALANLAAYRLDLRLGSLANSLDATYTRYADDLTFSGGLEFAQRTDNFQALVAKIVGEEGFCLNVETTRVLPRSVQQRVTGVVVNVRPNVPRHEYDELKAILTNCLRHGLASQNRDQHPRFREFLEGRVAHVAMLNPTRGRKLYALLDRVPWPR